MKLNQIKILVKDLNASAEFYSKVLGLETLPTQEAYQLQYRAGETILTLLERRAFDEAISIKANVNDEGGVVLKFQVPDVQASYAEALAAGAQTVKSPRRTPWHTLSAFLRDPDRVLIELYRPLTPTEELRARPER